METTSAVAFSSKSSTENLSIVGRLKASRLSPVIVMLHFEMLIPIKLVGKRLFVKVNIILLPNASVGN